jgi:hypothetical protein
LGDPEHSGPAFGMGNHNSQNPNHKKITMSKNSKFQNIDFPYGLKIESCLLVFIWNLGIAI